MCRRIDWFKDPECVKLIDFLVEKTKKVKEVLSVNGLGRKFKKRSGSKLGVDCWIGRIRVFRLNIHKMSRLDTETKVKLLFGLSAPLDDEFLRKLRKEAEITVDSSNRIIHYKKNGGGLELKYHKFGEQRDDEEVEEKHADSSDDSDQEGISDVKRNRNKCSGKRDEWLNQITDPEYVKLVDFLAAKTKEVKTILYFSEMIREFKKRTNSKMGVNSLKCRMHRLRPKIHKIPYLDTETKVRMMFGLSAPVDQGFLKELRKDAEVKVDDFNRIIHFKKKGGGLKLNGTHNPILNAGVSTKEILEFLAKKVKETSGILLNCWLCKQFMKETGRSQNLHNLLARFHQVREQIYESELFDEKMKVRMMFATSTEVEEYALKNLRKNATVAVDEYNHIIEYQSNDGSLYLNRKDCNREKKRIQNQIRWQNRNIDKSDDVEDSDGDEEDSSDESEEERTMNVTTRSGRLSKRIVSDAYFYERQDGGSPKNEKLKSSESNTPKTSNKKRKLLDHVTDIDKSKEVEDYEEEDEENDEDSSNESEVEGKTMNVTTRSGRVSKRNCSYIYKSQDGNSPRNEKLKSSESDTPTISDKKRMLLEYMTGSAGNKKPVLETPSEDRHDDDYSNDISNQYDDEQRFKSKTVDGPLNDDTSRRHIINHSDDFAEEIPIENSVAPKYEEMLLDVKLEEPDVISDTTDNKTNSEQDKDVSENSSEDVMGFDKPLEPDSTVPTENLVISKYEEMDIKMEESDVITDPNNTKI